MLETILASRPRSKDGGGKISFDDFSSVSGDTVPAKTVVTAPNGDNCVLYDNTGAGCMKIDLSTLLANSDFTIGFYVKPTSFTPVYGSTPSRGIIIQVGPFSSKPFYFHTAPVKAGYECDGNATYPLPATPADQWSHVALAFKRDTKTLYGFVNGAPVNRLVTTIPSSMIAYFGGIGDRPGVSGGATTRYGYRGYVSEVNVLTRALTETFEPLTFSS